MVKVINTYKPVGETPLETINKFRKKYPDYRDIKIAYAGRLDPMAHGVLVLLIEPETKNRNKYQNLDKTYEFEVLFGVSTNTHDTLGLITEKSEKMIGSFEGKPNVVVRNLVGTHTQKFPPYSSARVDGEPLYKIAREKRLSEIKIPEKEIEIKNAVLMSLGTISASDLKEEVFRRIDLVNGNFRQNEIRKSWNNFFDSSRSSSFPIARIKIKCSSGTYVRSIANDMGEKLGIPSLALNILRTDVGKYSLSDSIRLNRKTKEMGDGQEKKNLQRN